MLSYADKPNAIKYKLLLVYARKRTKLLAEDFGFCTICLPCCTEPLLHGISWNLLLPPPRGLSEAVISTCRQFSAADAAENGGGGETFQLMDSPETEREIVQRERERESEQAGRASCSYIPSAYHEQY